MNEGGVCACAHICVHVFIVGIGSEIMGEIQF